MDIRFISWAGYQLEETGGGTDQVITTCSPEFETEDVAEVTVRTRELKPRLVAFPSPNN